jgi:hypothetical protein
MILAATLALIATVMRSHRLCNGLGAREVQSRGKSIQRGPSQIRHSLTRAIAATRTQLHKTKSTFQLNTRSAVDTSTCSHSLHVDSALMPAVINSMPPRCFHLIIATHLVPARYVLFRLSSEDVWITKSCRTVHGTLSTTDVPLWAGHHFAPGWLTLPGCA